MKKRKKVVIGLVLVLSSMLFCNPILVRAEASWPQGPEIIGGNAIVMEAASGTVLYEKGSQEKLYPASITKIMTALLALENAKMEEKVTFSYNSVHKTEGSGIWRDVDEVMTMEQCMYALMLNSANECAYAIAEHVGGTYEDFVKMMNDRATALGCKNTHFCNPHGLTEEEHYTSCYDMALIARDAIKNETFRKIIGTKRYEIPPTNKHPDEITYLKNHQKMMFEDEEHYYEPCIGGKTGYTEAAGSTLVTYAEKDGMTLICVIMNSKSPHQFEDTRTLLDYCFENFQTYNISANLGEDYKAQLPEQYLSKDALVDIDQKAAIALPKGVSFTDAKLEVVTESEDENIVGSLKYSYGDRVVGQVPIEKNTKNVKNYPFEKEQEEPQKEKKGGSNMGMFFIIVLCLILAGAAGFGIYKFVDNFHLIRYKFYCHRNQNSVKVSWKELLKEKWRKK